MSNYHDLSSSLWSVWRCFLWRLDFLSLCHTSQGIEPRGYLSERHQHQWFPLPGLVPRKKPVNLHKSSRICETTYDKTHQKRGLFRLERPRVLRWKMMWKLPSNPSYLPRYLVTCRGSIARLDLHGEFHATNLASWMYQMYLCTRCLSLSTGSQKPQSSNVNSGLSSFKPSTKLEKTDLRCFVLVWSCRKNPHPIQKTRRRITYRKQQKTMSGLSNHSLLKWNKVITNAKSWIHSKTQHWIQYWICRKSYLIQLQKTFVYE